MILSKDNNMKELEFCFEGPNKMRTLRYAMKLVEIVIRELETNPRVTINFIVENTNADKYRGYLKENNNGISSN